MDYDFVPFCAPVHTKKRKLSDEVNDNVNAQTVEEVRAAGCGGEGQHFLTIPRSSSVFQTEVWHTADSALFLPLTEDLLVNVRRVDQISCADGHYFVADDSGKYSRTLAGKVLHLWRYDKTQRKLFISRSFLFTSVQEYLRVQRFLQRI